MTGKKLTFLSFEPNDYFHKEKGRFDVRSIFQLCLFLTELGVGFLFCSSLLFEEQVDLFCSYGSQLKRIRGNAEELDEASALKIAKNCLNAAVEVRLMRGDCRNIVDILGPQIQFSTVHRLDTMNGADLARCHLALSAKCCNVTDVKVRLPDGLKDVQAFFSTPKPKLKRLHLRDFEPTDEGFERLVRAIAQNSGGLQDICLGGPRISRGALEQLACANSGIDAVTVCVHWPGPEEMDEFFSAYLMDLVQSFSSCRFLKEISLKTIGTRALSRNLTGVTDRFVFLRNRNLSVTLDGVECPS